MSENAKAPKSELDNGRVTCPVCKSPHLLMRESIGFQERMVFILTRRQKHRCQVCGCQFRARGQRKPQPDGLKDGLKDEDTPSERQESAIAPAQREAERIAAPENWTARDAIVVALVLIIVVGGAFWYFRGRSGGVAISTPYQAVLLRNGSSYFGKIEGLGTPFPVLRDVFYVQSRQDQQTKQVSNIMVKRGNEWHAPDRMILNSKMIVLVEPVNPASRVAQLIAQAKGQ